MDYALHICYAEEVYIPYFIYFYLSALQRRSFVHIHCDENHYSAQRSDQRSTGWLYITQQLWRGVIAGYPGREL